MKYYRLMAFCLVFCLIPYSFAKQSIAFQVTLNKSKSQILLPVPNNLISVDASVTLSKMDIALDIKYKVLNSWPAKSDKKHARLLLIELNHTPESEIPLVLEWDNIKVSDKSSNFELLSNPTLVYPSSNWLAQALLLHPESVDSNPTWYTGPQSNYANYVTDKKRLLSKGYSEEKASQWLYDRPQAIYQLFIMSGDINWLKKGHELSNFYIDNINVDGTFKFSNKRDVKYLMPRGLLFKYLLSADSDAMHALKKTYQHSLKWDPGYSIDRGFWTERNQAAALNTAISYWEITGDSAVEERIEHIIDATVKMTFSPVNNWALVGCPQHTLKSHEGQGGYSPSCSPWMMALLSDALWRYYRLTNDIRAASLIDAFGDFILNHGIYWGDKKVNNIIIPKYLAVLENSRYEYLDQWTDHQHTCDVAGLLGKSVYIKKVNKVDDLLVKELFYEFIRQCKIGFMKSKVKSKNTPVWFLSPPRRFNWIFSTTSDLPWLELNIFESNQSEYD